MFHFCGYVWLMNDSCFFFTLPFLCRLMNLLHMLLFLSAPRLLSNNFQISLVFECRRLRLRRSIAGQFLGFIHRLVNSVCRWLRLRRQFLDCRRVRLRRSIEISLEYPLQRLIRSDRQSCLGKPFLAHQGFIGCRRLRLRRSIAGQFLGFIHRLMNSACRQLRLRRQCLFFF